MMKKQEIINSITSSFKSKWLKKEVINKSDAILLKTYKLAKNNLIDEIVNELFKQKKHMKMTVANAKYMKRKDYNSKPEVPKELRDSYNKNSERIDTLIAMNNHIEALRDLPL